MKITIAERFHPFSHIPGTKLLLPGSSLAVKVFPTRLEFSDLNHSISDFHANFSFAGPFKDFTAEVDLEKGWICVFGDGREGYLRYFLQARADGVLLTLDKMGDQEARCYHSLSTQMFSLVKNTTILFPVALQESKAISQERLSLGMHKSQEWQGIRRRLDCKEIFPLWHRLSAWTPTSKVDFKGANFQLLEDCQKAIAQCEKNAIVPAFERFFLAAFEGILVPRLFDSDYQGILPLVFEKLQASPLPLLTEGGKLIRSLFFQEIRETSIVLPCLPPQFHCGRMTGITTSQGHEIDLEWSKKSLRRLRLRAASSGDVALQLPKGISSCRIQLDRKTLKRFLTSGCLNVPVKASALLHLDRFQ